MNSQECKISTENKLKLFKINHVLNMPYTGNPSFLTDLPVTVLCPCVPFRGIFTESRLLTADEFLKVEIDFQIPNFVITLSSILICIQLHLSLKIKIQNQQIRRYRITKSIFHVFYSYTSDLSNQTHSSVKFRKRILSRCVHYDYITCTLPILSCSLDHTGTVVSNA